MKEIQQGRNHMQAYIERVTDDGFEVTARGDYNKMLLEYQKQANVNQPIHLCLDCSGLEDIPDFSDPLIQYLMKNLGIKVIDYDGTIKKTKAYDEKIKQIFQDD